MLISSNDFYPFLPVTLLVSNWIEDSGSTMLTQKWERALVSFYLRKENSKQEFVLIGSGFLLKIKNTFFVATASHVIMDIQKSDGCFVIIDNKSYALENVNIYQNEEQDYGFFELPEKAYNKGHIFFDSDERKELNKTSSFIIIGFPSTRNNLHRNKEFKGFSRLNLTFHHFLFDTESEDIYFHYIYKESKKNKHIFESASTFNSLPSLQGMSGCIVAQIMENSITGAFTLRPVGIFKEYLHKKDKYLVGCTLVNFADEINSYIQLYQLTYE